MATAVGHQSAKAGGLVVAGGCWFRTDASRPEAGQDGGLLIVMVPGCTMAT
ncbi:hypothetical protein VFPPC_16086 [Pochonia chlamydosporia 170]|uniref:Uncharacterized protein n=1 Tax=Pochonia chlamydosporia 170 TaxID=1380566 RepID=A0A179FNV0_METCM|nr:hypothetical protein VFPPC_16086 [Pochonia chlamydosporia 170]OAQ66958.1 hypothetical protein VFPPC_16086 [Pochonia chlamydosporia 170]